MRRPPYLALILLLAGCGTNEPSSGAGGSTASSGAGGGGSGGGSVEVCDNTGDCGDQNQPVTGCVACAEAGACRASVLACENSEDCISVVECDLACPNIACTEECVRVHPEGAQILFDFLVCVLCDQCPVDCKTDTSQCP